MTGAQALTVNGATDWTCPCGSELVVPLSRVVPDHFSPTRHWCRFSYCTLAPRVLAQTGRAA